MAISQLPAIAERSAQTTWTGPLASGEGTLTSEAAALCPISRLFPGAAITVSAYLEGPWAE